MRVGVTGSRHGPTKAQGRTLEALLQALPIDQLHHGDCVGVDEIAARFVDDFAKTESHPPINDKYRAWFGSDIVHKPKNYLDRNRDIVSAVELLIVVPHTRVEVDRSGTWATYRYAVSASVPRMIIHFPTGALTYEGV